MSTCDMCGKEAELVKARIEGTLLDVCDECARFGEIVERRAFRPKELPQRQAAAPKPKRKEILQIIVTDYADKIKNAREKMGLTQEEFSKKLNERVSIMQKMEAGQFKPSIDLARKLERELHVHLVEQYDEAGEIPLSTPKTKGEGFTLGDFVKVRKKHH
ncbi:TIGR00270 family protein [Candidatus Woesearchaeota archaeon]|nr:TIGR00270 family protein [Candidatus Woesearchaeota archaeon]